MMLLWTIAGCQSPATRARNEHQQLPDTTSTYRAILQCRSWKNLNHFCEIFITMNDDEYSFFIKCLFAFYPAKSHLMILPPSCCWSFSPGLSNLRPGSWHRVLLRWSSGGGILCRSVRGQFNKETSMDINNKNDGFAACALKIEIDCSDWEHYSNAS